MINYFEQLPIDIIGKIVSYNIKHDNCNILALMYVNKKMYNIINDNSDIVTYYISQKIKKMFNGITKHSRLIELIDCLTFEGKLKGLYMNSNIYRSIILNMDISLDLINDINFNINNTKFKFDINDSFYYYSQLLYIKYIYVMANRNTISKYDMIIYHTIYHNIDKLCEIEKADKKNISYSTKFDLLYLNAYYDMEVKTDVKKEIAMIKFIFDRSYKNVFSNIHTFIIRILRRKYDKLHIVGYIVYRKVPYKIDISKYYKHYMKLLSGFDNNTKDYYHGYCETYKVLSDRYLEYKCSLKNNISTEIKNESSE